MENSPVPLLLHSRRLDSAASGTLIEVTPEEARWNFIHFAVRQLPATFVWHGDTSHQETCLVLLRGRIHVTWDGADGEHALGPRASVFASYPFAAYLPPGTRFRVTAEEYSEVADCRAPTTTGMPARIDRPEHCGF